jgi:predicted class III extradiol MEMO1 family dioxygenase
MAAATAADIIFNFMDNPYYFIKWMEIYNLRTFFEYNERRQITMCGSTHMG